MSAVQELVPPHSLEVERGLLGMLLIHGDAVDNVSSVLNPDDFYEPVHSRLYGTMLEFSEARKPCTIPLLKDCLGEIDFGGFTPSQFLAKLAAEGTPVINAVGYARVIVDHHKRRKLLVAADQIREMVFSSTVLQPIEDLIGSASSLIDDVQMNGGVPEGLVTFGQAAKQSISAIAAAYQRDDKIAGVSTGLPTLDEKIGGLSDTDVVIIGGRPGSGKSALAVNISTAVAKLRPEKIGVFFSQEMSAVQLATRQISTDTKIPAVKLRNGSVSQDDFEELRNAAEALKDLNILIDGSAGIKLSYIASKLRQIARRKSLSFVVIDYLQLMQGGGKSKSRADNRNQELSEITAGIKTLAKQFNCPFIVLSQLSRDVEKRDDKRPLMADLRDSGSIEQDADVVLFVYREEYYLNQRKPVGQAGEQWEAWKSEMDRWKGMAEVIIGKNRHGPQGICLVGFDGDTTSFRELDEDEKQVKQAALPRSKVKLTKGAAPVYDAMLSAMTNQGLAGRCSHTPESAILTSEAFALYYSSIPSMAGDDTAAAEKSARVKFQSGMIWLRDEGVIFTRNETDESGSRAWLWFSDRKVRR